MIASKGRDAYNTNSLDFRHALKRSVENNKKF